MNNPTENKNHNGLPSEIWVNNSDAGSECGEWSDSKWIPCPFVERDRGLVVPETKYIRADLATPAINQNLAIAIEALMIISNGMNSDYTSAIASTLDLREIARSALKQIRKNG